MTSSRLGTTVALALVVSCAPARRAERPEPVRPPNPGSLYRRAGADWQAGRSERALLALTRLLAWYPDHLDGQRALAELLVAEHGADGAVGFLQERAAVHPGELGAAFALAQALARTGDEERLKLARTTLQAHAGEEAPPEVLQALADVLAALDDLDGATELLARLSAQRELADDPEGVVRAQLQAGRYHHLAGRFDAARASLTRAEAQARAADDPDGQLDSLHARGALDQSLGRLGDALAAFDQAAALAEAAGKTRALATALVNRAEVLASRYRDEEARQALDQAVGVAVSAGDGALEGRVRTRLARFELEAGRPVDAAHELERGIRALESTDAWDAFADALALLGRVQATIGNPTGTEEAFSEAVRVRRAIAEGGGAGVPLARTLVEWAEALAPFDPRAPRALFEQALDAATAAGSPTLSARALRGLAHVALRTGNTQDVAGSLDRLAALGPGAPGLEAELFAAGSDPSRAIAAAEAAVSDAWDVRPVDLPVRFGLLTGLYLRRAGDGDAERAWAAVVAGATALFAARLELQRVRPARGIAPEELAEWDRLAAALRAADLLLEEPLSPSALAAWQARRRDILRRRGAWRTRVAEHHPAWAGLVLPRVAFRTARPVPPPKGVAHVTVLPGEGGAVAFVAGAAGLQVRPLPPDRPLWETLAVDLKGVRRVVISPAPGLADLRWAAPGAGQGRPQELVLRPALAPEVVPRPAWEQADKPAEPARTISDPAAADLAELLAADLAGAAVVLVLPTPEVPGPGVDALARAALYAGAGEVQVRLPAQEQPVLRFR